ncbi:MAG: recombination protein RecR [Flavobacteriia bacterium]|nr:recombination protein RecR [Flavobacteriia bacterium]
MNIPSLILDKAVEQLSTLPGIGKRSALRLAISILNKKTEDIQLLAQSIADLEDKILLCNLCNNISDTPTCSICSSPNREKKIVCVVENIQDVMAIEETSSYKGVYHVLGGVISPIDGIGPNDLKTETLINKLQNGEVEEIILALNATMEGDTTNYYLYKKFSPFQIKITTLSKGVSIGSELQYIDSITLAKSLKNRLPFTI